jgi:hypothetical protein
MSNLRTVHKLVSGTDAPFNDLRFLSDYNTVAEKLSTYTLRSAKTYLSSAIVALHTVPDMSETLTMYQQKFKELAVAVREEDDTNKKTDRQSEKMIRYDELVKVRDRTAEEIKEAISIDRQMYNKVQAYMLLCIATMLPETRRTTDYTEMFVYDGFEIDKTHNDDRTRNYYIPEFSKMVFNVYKNSNTKGQQVVWLPAELNTILRESLDLSPHRQGSHNGTAFLVGATGGPCGNNGGAVQRLFDSVGLTGLSMSIIRNIVATHKDGEKVLRLRELEESDAVKEYKQVMVLLGTNAKLMCHSTAQHIRYVRFDDESLSTTS